MGDKPSTRLGTHVISMCPHCKKYNATIEKRRGQWTCLNCFRVVNYPGR